MCGVVGYVGYRQAQPILFNCLNKLEYRGYDSCGIAVSNGRLSSFKDAARVESLMTSAPVYEGTIGIGHTRWATHGMPTAVNAHPHFDCSHRIAVVHNGIISNYEQLKRCLINDGHVFASDTDTEVIPHLIERHYRGDVFEAVRQALDEVRGSYAIVVLVDGFDQLIVSRHESPLIIGIGNDEKIVASDVPAVLDYANDVVYLEDGDIALVSRDKLTVTQNRTTLCRKVHHVQWNRTQVEKNGYDHFLLKEIHEQPKVIRDSLSGFFGQIESQDSCLIDSSTKSLTLLGCGTSYHACLVGKRVFEGLLGIPVRTEMGSEFMGSDRIIPSSAVIGITQSGETADVLLSLKRLKQTQTRILVITNVPGSTASRLADHVIYSAAGPEMSVAATKSYIAQLVEIYKLALSSDLIEGTIRERLVKELRYLHVLVERVLENEARIADCADTLARYNAVFYVGRGINYPSALEGALKLKEISYIHAEGFAAGELKHGPLALLDETTPVVAMVTPDEVYESMVSTIKEVKARGSPVVVLSDRDDGSMNSLADMLIEIPRSPSIFSPVVNTVVLQLIAYYAARSRGCPIDFPRHLAKSVTVV